MKKEALIAIILGILLGIGGASFLIFKASPSDGNGPKLPQMKDNLTPVVDSNNPDIVILEIETPAQDTVVDADEITIKGKAQKGDLIVFQSPTREVTIRNDKADFSTKFPLSLGENVIMISAYSKNAKTPPQQKQLKVYYLDEE